MYAAEWYAGSGINESLIRNTDFFWIVFYVFILSLLTGKGKVCGKKTAAELPAWVDADNVSDADVIGTLSDTAQVVIDYSDPDPHL